jgi:hypothetical protein
VMIVAFGLCALRHCRHFDLNNMKFSRNIAEVVRVVSRG